MYYYDMGGFQIVGASPEILVRQELRSVDGKAEKVVTIRPIAGTKPRGATPELDARNEQDLLSDAKERAEHLMLIDLARNDIGRIAKTGSVKVTEAFGIERYSHVMHIVSNVEGVLKDGMSSLDVLRASFPAGTLSGAPKIHAMEIIDELETQRARRLWRRGGLPELCRRHGRGHRDPHRRDQGPDAVRAGGRRHRGRLGAGDGVEGDRGEEARGHARRRTGRRRLLNRTHAADDRQLRQLHLQPGAVLRRTRRGRAVSATTRSRSRRSPR
jgi:hypothetical protein